MNTLLLVMAAVCVLYLLLIMPKMSKRANYAPLLGHYYAHRGLYDNEGDAPENSMAAFRKAVDAGYGIELDVQLTKDRIPVIFHDETLKRICKIKGNVRDYTYQELQQFPLCKSTERIPRLADFLEMVDGKVPLIVEVKIHEKTEEVCSVIDALLREYTGPYCVESFHPLAVLWYKKHRPEVVRGQLSSSFGTLRKREQLIMKPIHYLMVNGVCKPEFIAYDCRHRHNLSRVLCRDLYGALSVAWTIKSQKQLDECRKDYDLFIFEGFRPREEQDGSLSRN